MFSLTPEFKNKDKELEPGFETMQSNLPSLLKSPTDREEGAVPVGNCWDWGKEPELFRKIDSVFEVLLRVTMSDKSLLSKSEVKMDEVLIPTSNVLVSENERDWEPGINVATLELESIRAKSGKESLLKSRDVIEEGEKLDNENEIDEK